MKYTILLLMLLVCIIASAAQAVEPGPATHTVTLETNYGDIVIELFGNDAPVTVANFLEYANSDFYDNLVFHRVWEGFVIQTGGYTPRELLRPMRWPIINEGYNGLLNLRGTVAMARTSDLNSATSQFFINDGDNQDEPSFQKTENYPGYCVFGRVIEGMNVVEDINTVPIDPPFGPFDYPPAVPVLLNNVKAQQVYVATDGDDVTGDGSEENPFATIQKGIDVVQEPGHVILMPGTYTGIGNRDIDFNGKAITVRSSDPEVISGYNESDTIATTIIDVQAGPGNTHRAFYFHNSEGAGSVIEGITIKGGFVASNGSAIYCNNASPTIKNCIITDNYANNDGGGIYCIQSSPVIINNNIVRNQAGHYGAAICSVDSSPQINGCIIWDNSGPDIIHGPADITYSDVQGGYIGLGNIDVDPHFKDPNNGIFHLKSKQWRWEQVEQGIGHWVHDSVTSRCIDAGNSGLWAMYESSPADYPRINMGAYSGTGKASMPPPNWSFRPDINNDGIVNFKDFAVIASDWLSETRGLPGDMDSDGTIFVNDILWIAFYWLKTTTWYPTLAGDFNRDGIVNFADFTHLAFAWKLANKRPAADFNGNQTVDTADLSFFAGSWLRIKDSEITLSADLNNDDIVNFADFAYLASDWQRIPVYQLPAHLDLDGNQSLDITDLRLFIKSWLDTEIWYE